MPACKFYNTLDYIKRELNLPRTRAAEALVKSAATRFARNMTILALLETYPIPINELSDSDVDNIADTYVDMVRSGHARNIDMIIGNCAMQGAL